MNEGLVAVVAVVALAGCGDPPPHARAQRIGALDEAIGGPHAIGRVGDFLLENDQIRLVIADTGVDPKDPSKSTYGRVNTTFGGTLVDADLRRPGGGSAHGNDQLAELLPGFVFSVINPTSVAVTGDGNDGRPAEVTVIGTPGDLLQMVDLLDTGLVGTTSLTFTQTYRLHARQALRRDRDHDQEHQRRRASVSVPRSDPAPRPRLRHPRDREHPAQRADGPAAAARRRAGAVRARAAGFNVRFAIEDSYGIAGGFPAFPGLAIDFLASRGQGRVVRPDRAAVAGQLRQRVRQRLPRPGDHAVLDAAAVHVRGRRRRLHVQAAGPARARRAVHVHVVLRDRQGRRRVGARHDLRAARRADRHVRRPRDRPADRRSRSPART